MIQLKRRICMALVGAVMMSCFSGSALALTKSTESVVVFSIQRATNRFNVTVPGKSWMEADSGFSLGAEERVTITASYLPRTASVDFGLIGPDGVFHYVSATGGTIDKSIQVDERGIYTLAIRNNSSNAIDVSGFVNY